MNIVARDLIQQTIADPKLAQNLRGQLSAALHLLDESLQRLLACDYAEHTVWVYERAFNNNQSLRDGIAEVRQFLHGSTTIEDVVRARKDFLEVHHRLQNDNSLAAGVAFEASVSVYLCILVCCQQQLEALGVVCRNNYQPDAESVAYQSSYAMARDAAGIDWDSDDSELRKAARERGRQASNNETKWQLDRLLEYVND